MSNAIIILTGDEGQRETDELADGRGVPTAGEPQDKKTKRGLEARSLSISSSSRAP